MKAVQDSQRKEFMTPFVQSGYSDTECQTGRVKIANNPDILKGIYRLDYFNDFLAVHSPASTSDATKETHK